MDEQFDQHLEDTAEDANVQAELEEKYEVKEVASSAEFEGELWLSSDMKNTVHVKANTREGRKIALAWAKEVYDRVIAAYGTKQKTNAETYNKGNGKKEEKPKVSEGNCTVDHTNLEPMIVKKEGANKGRWFTSCKECGAFKWVKISVS